MTGTNGGRFSRLLASRTDRLTVLYDGDCGFCRLTVQLLSDLDLEGRLEMVPLQHAAEHPERPELARIARDYPLAETIHVRREDGQVSAGGSAVLEILESLPAGWLFRPWRLVPGLLTVLDRVYQLVADNRGPISELISHLGRPAPVCDLHPPAARAGPRGSGLGG